MREILFRGKCRDTRKWYKGQYVHLTKTTYCFKEDYERDLGNDIHQIVFEKMTDWGLPNQHLRVDVLPETVGQYTGLNDKNGTKIFEGDILQFFIKDNEENIEEQITVIFKDCAFYAEERSAKERGIEENELLAWYTWFELEVIGNIHDNPELLKG